MASTIGTQANALLDDFHALSMIMGCLGRLAGHLDDRVLLDYSEVAGYLLQRQEDSYAELRHFIQQRVLPIAAHINSPAINHE